jgi:hypothetical protein
MADFSQLISHPKYHEIVDKLLHGSDPKEVANWLKLAYPEPDQAHLRLSIKLLQEFVKSGLMDYKQQFTQDLAVIKTGDLDKLNKKVAESLLNNKTYKERLSEVADKELDIREILKGTIIMLQTRLEQVFDRIQEDPANISAKQEYILINLADKVGLVVEKYDKIINQAPDVIIQHNINNQQLVDQKLAIFQQALCDTLAQIDAEASLLFIEKWTETLKKLQPPPETGSTLTTDQRLKEAKILQEVVLPPELDPKKGKDDK